MSPYPCLILSVSPYPCLTELIKRRTVSDCLKLTANDLISALQGVPANKLHSPALAIGALRDALKDRLPPAADVERSS